MSLYETHIALDIVVHYDAVPASRGHTDGRFGQQISPDEPASIDVYRIEADECVALELSEAQIEGLKAEISLHLCERDE